MSVFDLAFNLAWLIPLFPFAAFVAISVVTFRNHVLSHRLAIGSIAIASLLSQIVFWAAALLPVGGGEHAFESTLIPWLSIGTEVFSLGVYIDPVAAVMLFVVPLICMMIFVYSAGYMHGDPRYSHFFAYISLCTAGMLGMVVFDNLLAFFISLEIMGTCAYLLIGFWYESRSAVRAGLKAFLVTKVGNLLLVLGLVLLYSEVGSLAYRDIFSPETLEHLAHTPFLGTQWSMATVIALLLFGGAAGKGAQFPLYVWLPDAMAAPTPASALIHAATVDSAGIFLAVRTFPLLEAAEGGPQMAIVAAIGTFTAILASMTAIAQNDIKRVLAFSTISQLGYMVTALGIGAYVASAFHLITHAFFKALLFLGLGSVTHSMEHGNRHAQEHYELQVDGVEEFDSHDMISMGGLAKRMPHNFWTFLVGGLTLSGFPLVTAGFWSKHEILDHAYELSPVIFWILTVAAGLTSFYTMRQICLTFLGHPRSKAAEHAPRNGHLMTVPLIVLATFSLVLGWVSIPENFPLIGGLVPNWFHHFVGSAIGEGHSIDPVAEVTWHVAEASREFVWQSLAVSLIFKLGGLGLGWLVYGRKPMQAGERDRVEVAMRWVSLGWLYAAMRDNFYFDAIYQTTFVRGSTLISDLFQAFDHAVVDGLVNLVGRVLRGTPRASDWLDTHVVDGGVNLLGRMGRLMPWVGDWLDTHILDARVNLVGSVGRGISEASGIFDLRVVDHLVNLIGLGIRTLSALSGVVDRKVVDGAVDGIGATIQAGGRFIRPIQTGRVQNYLLLALLMALALVVTFLTILLLTTQ